MFFKKQKHDFSIFKKIRKIKFKKRNKNRIYVILLYNKYVIIIILFDCFKLLIIKNINLLKMIIFFDSLIIKIRIKQQI